MRGYVFSVDTCEKVDSFKNEIEPEKSYFLIVKPGELNEIGIKFDIMEGLNGNSAERRQHTGIETFKNHYSLKLDVPESVEGRVIVKQMDLYYGKNFIICSVNEELSFLSKIEEEIQKSITLVFKNSLSPINKIIYMIFDGFVIKSLSVISELERKIEAQEERILKIGKKNMINELIFLRRQVLKIRRYLNPLAYIGDVLILNELEFIDDSMLKYFSNISIKFQQLNNDANELYYSISNLREAYESEISNQLNEIMKAFTIVSTIFLPLTLVSGIYGMNFDYIPELKLRYGYFMILGFMACIAIGLILIFKKKKWI